MGLSGCLGKDVSPIIHDALGSFIAAPIGVKAE